MKRLGMMTTDSGLRLSISVQACSWTDRDAAEAQVTEPDSHYGLEQTLTKHAERKVSHGEILRLLKDETDTGDLLVLRHLTELADSFNADEAFAVMALVDTPDVFD